MRMLRISKIVAGIELWSLGTEWSTRSLAVFRYCPAFGRLSDGSR